MRTVSTRFIRGSEAIPILATRSRAESSCLSRRSRPDDSYASSFSDDASVYDAPLRVCVRLTASNHSFFDLRSIDLPSNHLVLGPSHRFVVFFA